MTKLQYLRFFLLPFSFIYSLAIKFKELLYHSSFLRKIFGIQVYHSKIPVICVGNIRVGGTGKSQIVLELAKKLLEKSNRVAILSRVIKENSEDFLKLILLMQKNLVMNQF